MANAPSSTPPPQQEQPSRPASFGATWHESDASFLQPGAVPLPKVHHAWERQPHSPFKRNGKYRKVWKRYELRSEPETQTRATNMERKSPVRSPRKVVKKRALDPPADPTTTPGRRAPKSNAFAPTRWETPRRHSGRIASRKIAQPMFARGPSPEFARINDSTSATKDSSKDSGAAGDEGGSFQKDQLLVDVQDEPMTGAQEDSENIAAPATDAKLEDDTATEDQTEEYQLDTVQSEGVLQSSAVEEGNGPRTAEATEEHAATGQDVEAPALHGPPSPSQEVTEPRIQPEFTHVAAVGENVSPGAVESTNNQEEEQADQMQPETDVNAHSASPILDKKRVDLERESEHMQEQSESAEAVVDALLEDQTLPDSPEPKLSEPCIQSDADNEQTEAAAAQPESVGVDAAFTGTDINLMPQDVKQLGGELPSIGNPLPEETAITQDDYNLSLEQQLQADAAEALGSDSALEEDEASLSEGETDESEHLDQDGFTLTDIPESEDDSANIPSPSLSAAESPKFSSIADTLTLNLPDRTPPKNRTTKEVTEDPSSPIDEDTAFLKDFLSRADASKASREAAATRLDTMTKRRDSDILRQALASPRMALDNTDLNSSDATNTESPSRKAEEKDNDDASSTSALDGEKRNFGDLTSDLTLEEPAAESPAPAKATLVPKAQSNRRSSRARQTRLPTTPSGPNRIQFRGASGADTVVIKKSDAQELAAVTRTNTKKNKGSALAAPIRLNKLKAEFLKAGTVPDAPAPDGSLPVFADPEVEVWQASKLRWDSQLAYFQEQDNLAGLTSLSDDESAEPAVTGASSQEKKEENSKKRKDKNEDPPSSTPARTRRVKGLGAGNGTPARGLLAPVSLLPAEVQAEKEKNDSMGEDGKAKKSKCGKKVSALPPPSSIKSGSGVTRGGKKADKTAAKEAQPTPTTTTETATPSQESNSKSDTTQPTPAPPSQLPAPIAASRRSRLQIPRKVKLPVPVSSSSAASSSTGIPAAPSPAPAAAVKTTSAPAPATQNSTTTTPGRLIGSTPRKMAGIAKPASVGDAGNTATQGLSAGRRRTATGAGRRG
ncbi:uncharacterized protein BKCO1_1000352 [Diplodia corticola]|uniref:Uncharacterized protein n=1 Tax=Diplodia corticola TaxID=236234 RepID=A0A1J9RJA7_9PEZI|nr:uncharacterized protein BKCO1_1000352 [Diplodia corticola]OJD40545.1 hypothetical protein BKCO1_1000352 [Diplodia corticola]